MFKLSKKLLLNYYLLASLLLLVVVMFPQPPHKVSDVSEGQLLKPRELEVETAQNFEFYLE